MMFSNAKKRGATVALVLAVAATAGLASTASAATNSGHVTCGYVYSAFVSGSGSAPLQLAVGYSGGTYFDGKSHKIQTSEKSADWMAYSPGLTGGYGGCS